MSLEEREVPVKLYYRIGEVAEIVGVEPHVLRYWETEFRSIRPQKSRKGQRIYSRRDVDKLLKVKDLLYTHGFTIAGADRKAVMSAVDRLASSADDMRDAAEDGKDASRALGLLRAANEEIQAFLDKHGLANAVGSTYRLLSTDVSTITAQFR